MKAVFASHGSLGDLVPFLEIGKVLVRGGHQAVVATHAAHRDAVEAAGLGFAPMRPDRPSDPAFHARAMHPRRGPPFIYKDFLVPAIAASDADLTAACRDADVLVSVTLALAAPIVAARLGLPWRSCAFQPAMLYSLVDPPKLPMLPFLRGKPDYNAFVLKSAKNGIERWVAPLRAYRRAEGLGEYPDHPVFGGQHSQAGVLALYSPLFGALPQDAPPGTVQTGQVLQSGGEPLAEDVAEFLARGEPPLVFTLGSASAQAARDFFRRSARIAERLGARALLLVGKAENLAELPSSERILAATTAPYHKVFPHAEAVIHQGGIGTIALALSAGRAMLLVPFAHDQGDNAARAARTGAARTLERWRYAFASGAVDAVRRSATMRSAAERCAAKINAENGAERAAAQIVRAAQQSGRLAS